MRLRGAQERHIPTKDPCDAMFRNVEVETAYLDAFIFGVRVAPVINNRFSLQVTTACTLLYMSQYCLRSARLLRESFLQLNMGPRSDTDRPLVVLEYLNCVGCYC